MSTEAGPLCCNVIVAEKDQATFGATHGVLNCKALVAPLVVVGEGGGAESKAQPEVFSELIRQQVHFIERVGHGCQPCPRFSRPLESVGVGRPSG